jgi:LysM repeat protein
MEVQMRKLFLTLFILMTMTALFIVPASAAPSAAPFTEICSGTYVVASGDSLSKIASLCGLTLEKVLSLNPQISNRNLIYTGQIVRLSESADYLITQISPLFWLYNSISGTPGTLNDGIIFTYTNTYYEAARVGLSTTQAEAGDWITVLVSGFPPNAPIDYRIGKLGQIYSGVTDGTTNAEGKASATITVPSNAVKGETWNVLVTTTGQVNAVERTSLNIYITNVLPSGIPIVSLSSTQAQPGDTIIVFVSGFPVNASVDYRVGKQGAPFSAVYDGTIDEDGKSSVTITIPGDAVAGESWVIQVVTTSQLNLVSGTSPILRITN